MSASSLAQAYLSTVDDLLRRIEGTEAEHVEAAARLLAARIAEDRLVHVYGPAATRTSPPRRSSSAPAA